MIINGSSAQTFQQCRTKVWNWRELLLESKREAEALTTGAAFHAGQAALYKGGSQSQALEITRSTYLKEMGEQPILADEQLLIDQNILFAQNSIIEHAKHWKGEPIEVLMPEVKFRVALPNTLHHCFFMHRRLHPEAPGHSEWKSPMTGVIYKHALEACEDRRCWIPHYYTGVTDAVIAWQGSIWLEEHKTTSVFSELYLDQFRLDKQPRQYIYGIQKATGIRPRGFLLNVIRKPKKDAVDRTRPTGFAREPYLVADFELERAERELILVANDYEEAFRTQQIYMNTGSCTDYFRKCAYFDSCKRGEHDPDEFTQRKSDYVDEQYDEILKEVQSVSSQ